MTSHSTDFGALQCLLLSLILLPLRVSSGFATDSLFTPYRRPNRYATMPTSLSPEIEHEEYWTSS